MTPNNNVYTNLVAGGQARSADAPGLAWGWRGKSHVDSGTQAGKGLGRLALALASWHSWVRGGGALPRRRARRQGAARDPAKEEFFEKKVRPCWPHTASTCHGGEKRREAEARFEAALSRGASRAGDRARPSRAEPLIEAIGYGDALRMPPRGSWRGADRHPERVGGAGAILVGGDRGRAPEGRAGGAGFSAEQKAFWAFRPVSDPSPPVVRRADWARSPLANSSWPSWRRARWNRPRRRTGGR
jgi:hypothetical protein